jgi:hypothetical protein
MDAVDSSRKLVNIYQIVLCHMLKDHRFLIHYQENPKSHIVGVIVLQVIGQLPKNVRMQTLKNCVSLPQ